MFWVYLWQLLYSLYMRIGLNISFLWLNSTFGWLFLLNRLYFSMLLLDTLFNRIGSLFNFIFPSCLSDLRRATNGALTLIAFTLIEIINALDHAKTLITEFRGT